MRRARWKRKNVSAGRSAQAQTSCRRRGMVDGPLRQSGTETRYPWGNHQPGEVRDTSCAAFRCRSPGSSGKPGDLPVGAVINRPGDSAGVPAGQCAPHSLFGCAKKRTRRARCKRKRRRARSGAVALRAYGGRRTSACSDLALPSGTLCSSAISPTAVPWRMVRKLSGCKNAFDQLLFPRVPLRYALPGRL